MKNHDTTTTVAASSPPPPPPIVAAVDVFAPESLPLTGYSIITTEWNMLGFGNTTNNNNGDTETTDNYNHQAATAVVASSSSSAVDKDKTIPILVHHTIETSDPIQLQHRLTAIFVARCAAMVEPVNTYDNLSMKAICTHMIEHDYPMILKENNYKIIYQLSEFIRRMIMGYKDVPYHNRKHAYHVVVSTTKLIDMMVCSGSCTYGIKYDPIALFALCFAALIHDVEHQGIPNRQLALEDDRLAVLYNDQSMAENWSLYVAFSEFLQDEFIDLRNCLFNNNNNNSSILDGSAVMNNNHEQNEEYRRFRKLVINLVLSTDLASPERTQIGKSKWKEAFGDPYETLERKLRDVATCAAIDPNNTNHQLYGNTNNNTNGPRQRRSSMTGSRIVISATTTSTGRRGSAISAISTSPQPPRNNNHHHHHHHDDYGEEDNFVGDDSLSGTPDPSDDEDDDDNDEDDHNHNLTVAPKFLSEVVTTDQLNTSALRDKLERRMSASSVQSSKYRQRLGILRTVDLSGETFETYSRRGSMATAKSNQSATSIGTLTNNKLANDEPDELKATVVMETIITAADVAHNLQSWNHMVRAVFFCCCCFYIMAIEMKFPNIKFLPFLYIYYRSNGLVDCIWNYDVHMLRDVVLIHKISGTRIRLDS
jgi:hypothetical protein